ncbi:MAG TPA: multidrug effflux MFS transporter [Solirubrobacteraceae bacterium]|nr:multidrug effflux MFS transporter [Solirubrobacteraceae bacterium]
MTALAPARLDRRTRVQLALILGGLTAFAPLSIDMYLPGLPALGAELSASASTVQLTLTACMAGLAIGQLVAGPLSDRFGRRPPLLAGVAGYTLASALCAIAPTVWALAGLRFAQGATGAAGIVIARAVVRDTHEGAALVRFFSMLMLVTGLAPILAPVIGGQVLEVTTWRGIFLVLAAIGAALFAAAALGLRESLPPGRRRDDGVRATARTMATLLRDRHFAGFALAGALAFGALFTYVAGSPFVLQDLYGASPQAFSAVFAVNSIGIVAFGQLNGRLAGRVPAQKMLWIGVTSMAVSGTGVLAVVLIGSLPLAALLVPMWALVASMGLVFPNSIALALAGHPEVAGSASALIGVLQFVVGAIAAPLAGIAGAGTAVPMGAGMAAFALLSLAALRLSAR